MFGLGAPELIIIAIVIVLLFGFKKLPDASRSVGRSLRIFKSEMREMSEDDKRRQAVREIPTNPPTPETPVSEAEREPGDTPR